MERYRKGLLKPKSQMEREPNRFLPSSPFIQSYIRGGKKPSLIQPAIHPIHISWTSIITLQWNEKHETEEEVMIGVRISG